MVRSDNGRLLTERDLLPENLWVTAESAFPKRIGQDNDAVRFILCVFLRKATAHERWHSQDIENLGSDGDAFDILRVISLSQRARGARVSCHGREALALVAEIDVVRKGVDVAADRAAVIRITPPGHHDLIGVLEGQRP